MVVNDTTVPEQINDWFDANLINPVGGTANRKG